MRADRSAEGAQGGERLWILNEGAWFTYTSSCIRSEGCNNSKSGRGVIFQPRLSREYTTKQAEITPSLVGIGGCVMNSKGRYHAHALVAFLTEVSESEAARGPELIQLKPYI